MSHLTEFGLILTSGILLGAIVTSNWTDVPAKALAWCMGLWSLLLVLGISVATIRDDAWPVVGSAFVCWVATWLIWRVRVNHDKKKAH